MGAHTFFFEIIGHKLVAIKSLSRFLLLLKLGGIDNYSATILFTTYSIITKKNYTITILDFIINAKIWKFHSISSSWQKNPYFHSCSNCRYNLT